MTSMNHLNPRTVDQLLALNLKDHIDVELYTKICSALNQNGDFISVLNRFARDEFELRNYNASVYIFRIILDYLSDHAEFPDKNAILLDTILASAQLIDYHHKLYPSIKQYLKMGLEISIQLNDLRKQILIILNLGIYNCTAGYYDKAYSFFSRGLDMADKLGDRDILLQTEFYRGFFCLFQGHYQEGISYFEHVLSYDLRTIGLFPAYNIVAHLYTGYIHAGEYYQAINLMKSNMEYAVQVKDHISVRICRFYLCWGLLMSGNLNEALKELDGLKALEVSDIKGQKKHDLVTLPIKRTEAYYWYLRGDYQKAYQLASEEGPFKKQFDIRRINFPCFYELLFCFKNKGFDPIPGYDDFEAYIDELIQGAHLALRGIALRLKAKDILLNSGMCDKEKIWTYFKTSERDLKTAGSRIELAKTRAEMALFMLDNNEEKLARKMAVLAWSSISLYENLPFPDQLFQLINVQPQQYQKKSKNDVEFCIEFFDVLKKIVPSENNDEFLSNLLSQIARFFLADNGCIFEFVDTSNAQPTLSNFSYNLDVIRYNDEQFDWVINKVKQIHLLQKAQVLVVPEFHVFENENQTIHTLFIPFRLKKEFFGVLYVGNMFAASILNQIDEAVLLKLSEYLSSYVDNQWRLFNQSKTKCLSAIGRVTNSIRVFDNSSSFYHGTSRQLTEQASRLASSNASILILGETGVGKNHLARLLHDFSNRKEMPFIHVNISGLSDSLVESELFGYEKGAFTGADRQKIGMIELANKGTLFIDEVGDIPKPTQVKILQVLEEKMVTRVGGIIPRRIDFRLIAATNHDLVKDVENGDFREDLYYRLNVVPLVIPPLREREDEIIKLAGTFLSYYAKKYKIPTPQLSPEDEITLRCYHWPGNIRELKNIIEQAVLLSDNGQLRFQIPRSPNLKKAPRPQDKKISFFGDKPTLDELQRQYIHQVLAETGGQIGGKNGAAKILGMKRTTLYNRMEKLGIRRRGAGAPILHGELNTLEKDAK